MKSYSFTKQYEVSKLITELNNVGLFPDSIDIPDSTHFTLNFSSELSANMLLILNQCVSLHTIEAQALVDIVAAKILLARQFGTRLIAQYGASNVLAGYSLEQIQDIVSRTQKVLMALNTGSLYVAIAELNQVQTDEVLITEEKVTAFRNKIEDFLGIPRT